MYGTGVCGNNGAPWCVSVLENPCAHHGCEGKGCGDKCLMGDMEFECNAEGICDGYHHDCGKCSGCKSISVGHFYSSHEFSQILYSRFLNCF